MGGFSRRGTIRIVLPTSQARLLKGSRLQTRRDEADAVSSPQAGSPDLLAVFPQPQPAAAPAEQAVEPAHNAAADRHEGPPDRGEPRQLQELRLDDAEQPFGDDQADRIGADHDEGAGDDMAGA